jgi:Ser/Thr protein kinase RdoA (MazF antagonist)
VVSEDQTAPPTVTWTTDDVRAFLGRYGRTPARLDVEQLRSWWCNIVLRLDADGEQLVLRRYGLTPAEEVRWELALLLHLRANDFPSISPLAVARPDGTDPTDAYLADFLGAPAILYRFIKGDNACQGRVEPRRAIAQTAAVVARLHELTIGLALPHPRVRSGTDSRRLLREFQTYVTQRGLAASGPKLRDLMDRSAQMERHLASRLAPYNVRVDELPRGIVHHDAHCANVLFHHDQLVALIDFDDACDGFLVEDLAAMIANWAAVFTPRAALDPDQANLVVHEYERHRHLTPAEHDLLPDVVAAFMLADGATHVRERLEHGMDGDAAVETSSVYRRYQHHAGDPDRMLELRRMFAHRIS